MSVKIVPDLTILEQGVPSTSNASVSEPGVGPAIDVWPDTGAGGSGGGGAGVGTKFGQLLTTLGPPGTPTSLPLTSEWISPTDNPTWTQATWFVDPQNVTGTASDLNSGIDAAHAVLSYTGGIVAKWGTTNPTLRQDTTLTWLSSQVGNGDSVVFNPRIEGVFVLIQGALGPAQVIHSGVLAGVVPKNRLTPQLLNADLGFAAPRGSLVQNITKPSLAWVFRPVAGTTFAISQPLDPHPGIYINGVPINEVDTWANGDSFTVSTLIAVNIVQLFPILTQGNGQFSPQLQVNRVRMISPNGVAAVDPTYFGSDVALSECDVQAAIVDSSGADVTPSFFLNCAAEDGALSLTGADPLTDFLAGFLSSPAGCRVAWGFDFDAILDGTSNEIDLVSTTVFESAFQNMGQAYIVGQVKVGGIMGFNAAFTISGVSQIWGPGLLDTVGHARLYYSSAPGAAVATFANTGGIRINGQTNANTFVYATGAWSAAFPITAANLDNPAALHGLAINVGGAAISNQGTA